MICCRVGVKHMVSTYRCRPGILTLGADPFVIDGSDDADESVFLLFVCEVAGIAM